MKKYVAILFLIFFVGILTGMGMGKKERIQEVPQNIQPMQKIAITATPTPQVVTLMAVGDVMLSRTVDEQMKKRHDWVWPWASTAATLKGADITVGNLETPLLSACPPMTNRMVFCAEAESRTGLKESGFDLMSLANNHTFNQGKSGMTETERLLEQVEILGVREGELEVVEKGGIVFGFLAYDDVSKQLKTDLVKVEVASAAASVDVLIGMIHWGVEYVDTPTARQVALAHTCVDAGMKVVLGSHPHWTQSTEKYNEGVIVYSLGNFVFDQMWSEETRRGDAINLRFQILDHRILSVDYELLPVRIYDFGQPRWIN